jgi:hypothetical protein
MALTPCQENPFAPVCPELPPLAPSGKTKIGIIFRMRQSKIHSLYHIRICSFFQDEGCVRLIVLLYLNSIKASVNENHMLAGKNLLQTIADHLTANIGRGGATERASFSRLRGNEQAQSATTTRRTPKPSNL